MRNTLKLAWAAVLLAAWLARGETQEPSGAPPAAPREAQAASGARELQAAFVAVARSVSPCVVAVRAHGGAGAAQEGSGVVVEESGFILTNEHVVRGTRTATVIFVSGKSCRGRVTGTDPRADLAVIKVDAPQPLAALAWGDSDKVEIGQWAIAVGNPFGFSNTVTVGVVSAVERPLPEGAMESIRARGSPRVYYGSLIQTDAALSAGSSGGALVDLDGRLVGINALIGTDRSSGRGSVGFAIPANVARAHLEDLKAGREVRYGWLGVRPKDLAGPLAAAFGVAEGEGVLVDEVVPESPAARARIRRGEVITSFADEPVHGTDQLIRLVGQAKVGARVRVLVRDVRGESREATVVLRERPGGPPGEEPPPDEPLEGRTWRGLILAPVEGASGVPVAEVQAGSAAARAGLAPGMRIDEVGASAAQMSPIRSKEAFEKAVFSLKGAVLIHAEPAGYIAVEE